MYWTNVSDATFGYRIFPSELVKRIKWEELRHPFMLETMLKPIRCNVPVVQVNSTLTARTEGDSRNSLFRTFFYIKTLFRCRIQKEKDILL